MYENHTAEIMRLKERLSRVDDENLRLRKQNSELRHEKAQLENEIIDWRDMASTLRRQVRRLREAQVGTTSRRIG